MHDITKLPRWAQYEIARRDRRIEALEAASQPPSEATNTVIDHFGMPPAYLAHGEQVRFILDGVFDPEQPYRAPQVCVRVTDQGLYLLAGRGLLIKPQSGNTALVRDDR